MEGVTITTIPIVTTTVPSTLAALAATIVRVVTTLPTTSTLHQFQCHLQQKIILVMKKLN